MIARWLIALSLAVALLLPVGHAGAVDLAEYRAHLDAAAAALDGPAPDAGAALAELRAVDSVTLADGTAVAVDLSAIVAALEADPPNIEAARAGIGAAIDVLDTADLGVAADVSGSRDALDDVLARQEFQTEQEDESQSLGQRILGWIDSQLTSFFNWLDRLFGNNSEDSGPSRVMAVIGVLVVAGVVIFAIRSIRQAMTPGVTRLEDGTPEERYTSAEARAEAERLFAAGEYRAALRMLYLATLIRWEEAGRLRFDRSLTNREVVARVNLQGDAALLEQLSPMVDRFDRVWYGGAPCTSEDYTSFASLAERAWEAA